MLVYFINILTNKEVIIVSTCWNNLMVSIFYCFHQFRYADRLDITLMILGAVAAVINGTCLPLLSLVFGEMSDSFVINCQSRENVCKDVINIYYPEYFWYLICFYRSLVLFMIMFLSPTCFLSFPMIILVFLWKRFERLPDLLCMLLTWQNLDWWFFFPRLSSDQLILDKYVNSNEPLCSLVECFCLFCYFCMFTFNLSRSYMFWVNFFFFYIQTQGWHRTNTWMNKPWQDLSAFGTF